MNGPFGFFVAGFLLMTIVNVAASAATVIECLVPTRPVSARLTVSSLGEASLQITERITETPKTPDAKKARSFVCPLRLAGAEDERKAVLPGYSFQFQRGHDCTPVLPEELEDGIKRSIDLRIRVQKDKKPSSFVFLYELREASDCEIRTFKEFDVQLNIPRWNKKLASHSIPPKTQRQVRKLKIK